MFYSALLRAVAIAVAVALTFGAVLLRERTSPSGEGFWTALAAAPAGGVYLADEQRRELILLRDGQATVAGHLPQAIYRGLSAYEHTLLLATEGGLYVSTDQGQSWRNAIPGRRFTAVAMGDGVGLAGAWAEGLWRSEDAGLTWQAAQVPRSDTEFEALQAAPYLAATLLGVLESDDRGQTWHHLPGLPDRATALYDGYVGDWRGDLYRVADGLRVNRFKAGIWSITTGLVATTDGIYPVGAFVGREVTRVVSTTEQSGFVFYAALARGGLYRSPDGGLSWSLVYQP
ncbi:MAG: hypothetical protein E6I70_03805 [Chloroflexi bacterium]|nr:MAG: hypothetical protein E6I70_03805 [Chloroflexota bacterium]